MEISDRIEQLESELRVLKDNLLNYICQVREKDPNPQWTNMRLEALESKIKITSTAVDLLCQEELNTRITALEQKQNPEQYNGTE